MDGNLFERIKILFQTNQCGWKFMFQGIRATFYRETPGFAIYFSVYNYLKDNVKICYLFNLEYFYFTIY